MVRCAIALFALAARSIAAPLERQSAPNVVIDYGNFIGSSSRGIDKFLGIPFAQAPLGDLRLRNPLPPNQTYTNYEVTTGAPACPFTAVLTGTGWFGDLTTAALNLLQSIPWIGEYVLGISEDCLTLDIVRPAGVKGPLPVMFWLFGGSFQLGGTGTYDGTSIVTKSVELGQPVIYVAANYRTNVFGFLGGKEVADAGVGNLGLKDQRLALQWVQKYISKFGGDPTKVTAFGESAGAISISYQMLAYDGKLNGLFRGAICESGTAIPVGPLSNGQEVYDRVASFVGCSSAADSLACIRKVPYTTLLRAVNSIPSFFSYKSLHLPWAPYTDGEFLTDASHKLLAAGKYAKEVTLISGDQDDEGTLLTLGTFNLTTTAEVKEWLMKVQFPKMTSAQADRLLQLYPFDVTAGSPFNTGLFNTITPQNKRVAALAGDYAFQAPRRLWLSTTQATQKTYGYISRALKATPLLGSFHATDILSVFGILPGRLTDDFQSRWISFANTLDPNVPGLPRWSQYGSNGNMLEFRDSGSTGMVLDNWRKEGMAYMISIIDNLIQ